MVQNNLIWGTNKNELRVLGKVEPLVGQTSDVNLLIRVGQTVIRLRCSENTQWKSEHD